MATLGLLVLEDATLKGLRRRPSNRKRVATPSELRRDLEKLLTQGFKANPGLKLANAYSVRWKSFIAVDFGHRLVPPANAGGSDKILEREMVQDFIAGIDIGGTKIAVAIASAEGELVGRSSFPTDHDRSPRESMTQALEILVSLADTHQGQLTSIGIGCAGPLDFDLGHVLSPPNMPRSWRQFPLRSFVENELELPVALDNDANAAALGEHLYGAGRGYSDLVYLTISTGIGVGIIAGNSLVHRLGEGGHVTVQPGGALCGCGARGCMETLCSGTGIARRAQEQLHSGRLSEMLEIPGVSDIQQVTARTVEDAARKGDHLATEVWGETIDLLSIGIGSIVALLAPQAVILGGGVATGSGEFLLQPLREALKERVHIISLQSVEVLQAGLGSESVIHGALVLAARALQPVRT